MIAYYAGTDENGVLCVDQVDETSQDEAMIRQLAVAYPETIYFLFPETPVSDLSDTSNREDET